MPGKILGRSTLRLIASDLFEPLLPGLRIFCLFLPFFYSLACSKQLLTATSQNYPTGDDLCSNGFGQFDSKKNQL